MYIFLINIYIHVYIFTLKNKLMYLFFELLDEISSSSSCSNCCSSSCCFFSSSPSFSSSERKKKRKICKVFCSKSIYIYLHVYIIYTYLRKYVHIYTYKCIEIHLSSPNYSFPLLEKPYVEENKKKIFIYLYKFIKFLLLPLL